MTERDARGGLNEQRLREAVERCEECDLPTRVTTLEQAVFGDKRINLPGILPTLDRLVRFADRIDRFQWVLVGLAIGAGLGGGVLTTLVLNALKAVAAP